MTTVLIGGVGILFAALALHSMWLDTQDADDLREMGIMLEYKDEQVRLAEMPLATQHHAPERHRTARTKRPGSRPFHRAPARGYPPV
jgi:hypothetical protein